MRCPSYDVNISVFFWWHVFIRIFFFWIIISAKNEQFSEIKKPYRLRIFFSYMIRPPPKCSFHLHKMLTFFSFAREQYHFKLIKKKRIQPPQTFRVIRIHYLSLKKMTYCLPKFTWKSFKWVFSIVLSHRLANIFCLWIDSLKMSVAFKK